MKVILSRKGFDSSAGGDASPILPNGEMISLPIPDSPEASLTSYQELRFSSEKSYLDLMKELPIKSIDEFDEKTKAHLDPDLRLEKPNNPNWRPSFGQSNGVQSHLENQDVEIGDLFLFYGWFRHTFESNGVIKYDKKKLDKHIIWGYLQIGEIFSVPKSGLPKSHEWLHEHPHCCNLIYNQENRKKNVIYIASNYLSFAPSLKGAGTFNYDESLVLTAPNETRKSQWALPFSNNNEVKMSKQRQEHVIQSHNDVESWAQKTIIMNAQ